MTGYTVCAIADIPAVPGLTEPADPEWKPIQHHLGLTAFGLNAYIARRPGDELAAAHDESGSAQEEVYVVLAGRACFTLGGEEVEAGPGTVVAVRDPGLSRAAEALEAGTTVLAIGCRAGCFVTSWDEGHFADVPRHPTA
jgi:uncharacterized cupin superfamily protein